MQCSFYFNLFLVESIAVLTPTITTSYTGIADRILRLLLAMQDIDVDQEAGWDEEEDQNEEENQPQVNYRPERRRQIELLANNGFFIVDMGEPRHPLPTDAYHDEDELAQQICKYLQRIV